MTNEVIYYPSSIRDNAWKLSYFYFNPLLLRFNYETKCKSSHDYKEGYSQNSENLIKVKSQAALYSLQLYQKWNFPTHFFFFFFTVTGLLSNRSSPSQMFFKIVVLKNFAIFTGKYLRWRLFLIKLPACKFIKKGLQRRCFPVNIAKFLRKAFL